jgi:prolyl-tRNA editing enzyme YbaK/EbsC (Cys-tRNA(Pro) deacylase)
MFRTIISSRPPLSGTRLYSQLSENAAKVQSILAEKRITSEVKELTQSTHTAQEAAQAIGCELSQIAKSLVFRTALTNRPVLVVASGPTRVNEKVIAQHLGEKIVKADPEFTQTVTGFPIGGVPPLLSVPGMLCFLDEDLMQLPQIWAAAGTPHAVFSLKPEDLRGLLVGCQIINIKDSKSMSAKPKIS